MGNPRAQDGAGRPQPARLDPLAAPDRQRRPCRQSGPHEAGRHGGGEAVLVLAQSPRPAAPHHRHPRAALRRAARRPGAHRRHPLQLGVQEGGKGIEVEARPRARGPHRRRGALRRRGDQGRRHGQRAHARQRSEVRGQLRGRRQLQRRPGHGRRQGRPGALAEGPERALPGAGRHAQRPQPHRDRRHGHLAGQAEGGRPAAAAGRPQHGAPV